MKRLAILRIILFYQTIIYSQSEKSFFNVEVKGQGQPIILIPGLSSSGKEWERTTVTTEKIMNIKF